MNRIVKALVLFLFLLILFRGPVFRSLIRYEAIETRPEINISNADLINRIAAKSVGKKLTPKKITEIADAITTETLKFTTRRASQNPNELIVSRKANCIGYAAMFNAIANYLIKEHRLHKQIEAQHNVGKIYLCGVDLHQFFANPFFKDHDFNQIKDRQTGEIISTDASVSDYLWITRVVQKKVK